MNHVRHSQNLHQLSEVSPQIRLLLLVHRLLQTSGIVDPFSHFYCNEVFIELHLFEVSTQWRQLKLEVSDCV